MLQAIQRRVRSTDERGFTLIELMVVVLIIAILIAIAIPTFLGARTKAQDRAAQSDLRTALVTAQAYYTDNEVYGVTDSGVTAGAYQVDEPSIDFEATANTTSTTVGVYDLGTDFDQVVLVKRSKSGQWFCIGQNTSNPTEFGKSDGNATTDVGDVDSYTECAAATAW